MLSTIEAPAVIAFFDEVVASFSQSWKLELRRQVRLPGSRLESAVGMTGCQLCRLRGAKGNTGAPWSSAMGGIFDTLRVPPEPWAEGVVAIVKLR